MSDVLSKVVLPVAFLAVGLLGYQLGAGQNHPTAVQMITLDNVQVSQLHPAALYVRTPDGHEQRFQIMDLTPDWAYPFRQHPKAHWYMQLGPSPWCPHHYMLQTAVERTE